MDEENLLKTIKNGKVRPNEVIMCNKLKYALPSRNIISFVSASTKVNVIISKYLTPCRR